MELNIQRSTTTAASKQKSASFRIVPALVTYDECSGMTVRTSDPWYEGLDLEF
jgi:hypothetical protein